jgi:hypothetical protein
VTNVGGSDTATLTLSTYVPDPTYRLPRSSTLHQQSSMPRTLLVLARFSSS